MNRFKFSNANLKAAIAFVQNKSKDGPTFAKRFKDDLKVKKNKLFYQDREVVPVEKVDAILRNEIYKKNGDVSASRDAAHHLIKQRYCGITRRSIMKFLQAQKSVGETMAAVAKPKQSAGVKMKGYSFETDLVFIKRDDCIAADPKFDKLSLKDLPEMR